MAKKQEKSEARSSSADDGKVCGILAYLLVGIIWYFADEKMKRNAFAKYHVKQGLVLLITWVIVAVVGSILAMVPFIGWFFMLVLEVCMFIIWLLGIIAAINGQQKPLPVIGQFADKFTF